MKFKPLFLILFLALFLRLFGLNWDQGQHLHPDERFLTMVANDISLPLSVGDYLNSDTSPLNPYNYPQYQFFVYGTFPLFLTKTLAVLLGMDSYSTLTLLGRALSALFDFGTVILLYHLAKLLFPQAKKLFFLAPLLYTLFVLPIQHSHFFVVDTFLTFFLTATFFSLSSWFLKKSPSSLFLASLSFGLAMSCKVSAIYFAPTLALFFLFFLFKQHPSFKAILLAVSLFSFFSFFTFRFFQPYAFTTLFTPNPKFLENLQTLQSFNNPNAWFPPGVQWLNRIPLLFPLKNLILWGLGLPLSLLLFYSFFHLIKNKKYHSPLLFLSFFFPLSLFLIQGLQPVTTMRYFLPLYPFLALLSAPALFTLIRLKNHPLRLGLFFALFLYSLAFFTLYLRPHSRVTASFWIYQNIPPASSLANEHWDDPLPLHLPGHNAAFYQGPALELYGPDNSQKWQIIWSQLGSLDYLFLSSNRLWASIPRVPDRYPLTSRYYQDLFDEKLGFKKIVEINSYPGFPLPFLHHCFYFGPTNYPYQEKKNSWFAKQICSSPGIYFRDDTAEEAFSVYDHPQVLVFQKK